MIYIQYPHKIVRYMVGIEIEPRYTGQRTMYIVDKHSYPGWLKYKS